MARKRPAPRVVIFAGPNGAGKTTHADAIVQALGIKTFVNADFIARGLSGQNTETAAIEAGRIMLKRLKQLASEGEDFAFESTLSSRSFSVFLKKLKAQGYRVAVYYFSLANAQLALRRIKLRVSLGGHDVPADVVQRRFGRSLSNFFTLYAPLADTWSVFDNSIDTRAHLIATATAGKVNVEETKIWLKLQTLSTIL